MDGPDRRPRLRPPADRGVASTAVAAPEFVPIEPNQRRPHLRLAAPAARPVAGRPPRRLRRRPPPAHRRRLGVQGPDQGYALKLARILEPELSLTEGEHADDAIAGIVAIALKRASAVRPGADDPRPPRRRHDLGLPRPRRPTTSSSPCAASCSRRCRTSTTTWSCAAWSTWCPWRCCARPQSRSPRRIAAAGGTSSSWVRHAQRTRGTTDSERDTLRFAPGRRTFVRRRLGQTLRHKTTRTAPPWPPRPFPRPA